MQTARRFSRDAQRAGSGCLVCGGVGVGEGSKRLARRPACFAGATHGGSVGLDGIVLAATRSVRVRVAWCAVALGLVRNLSTWRLNPHASLGLRMAAQRFGSQRLSRYAQRAGSGCLDVRWRGGW